MTLAFTHGLSRRSSPEPAAAPAPLSEEEIAQERLARLHAAMVANDAGSPASPPARPLEAGVDAAPWQDACFSITRSLAGKPLAAAGLGLLAVIVVMYAGWHYRGGKPAASAGPAAEATVGAQAGGEGPLPQDLAAMAAAPAVAPKVAPGAVLKALAALSPAAVEPAPAAVAPVASESASAVNSAGWARSDAPARAPAAVSAPPASGWAKAQEPQQLAPLQPPDLAARQSGTHSQVPQAAQAVITWPAAGPITSLYGPAHPLGIDIGIPLGTPLRAAAAGRVTFTGGDPCCSYGYYIDIDHGNGVMTRYGHLVQPSPLRPGQVVRLGDFIGYSGSTGYSTGPHLHFEIRLNGRPVDPLLVLP